MTQTGKFYYQREHSSRVLKLNPVCIKNIHQLDHMQVVTVTLILAQSAPLSVTLTLAHPHSPCPTRRHHIPTVFWNRRRDRFHEE